MARFSVLTLDTAEAWRAFLNTHPPTALTATPDYCNIFEENGDGRALFLTYEDSLGALYYPVMLRPLSRLPFSSEVHADLFDLSTPYGYGGIYTDCAKGDRRELLRRFRKQLASYAMDTGIVSEFIRFDPIHSEHSDLHGLIDIVRHHNDNIVIDLSLSPEAMLSKCRQSFRSGIRQTARLGLEIERIWSNEILDEFVLIYRQAMERRRNYGYLNFNDAFFQNLFSNLKEKIDLFCVRENGTILAAAITLRSNKVIEYFLAANRRIPERSYVNHFLLIKIAEWAKENGFKSFHLGGGADTIQFFKSGFSNTTVPYYVGSHIFSSGVYDALVKTGQSAGYIPTNVPEFFFPAYRAYLSPSSDRALLDALDPAESSLS